MTPPPTSPSTSPPPSLLMREPVRVYLYGLAVTVAAGLVLFGVITDEVAEFVGAAAAQLLGVGLATEAARAVAYSPATVSLAARRTSRAVLLQTGSVDAAGIVADLDPMGRHAA